MRQAFVREGGRQLSNLGKHGAQSFMEETLKDQMGLSHIQTGQVTVGGAAGALLYKYAKDQFGSQSPHTTFEAVSKLKVKGFTTVESLAIIEGQNNKLDNSSIQRMMASGTFGVAGAAMLQRESLPLLKSADAVVSSEQKGEQARAAEIAAKERASMPLEFFLNEEQENNHRKV